MLQVLDASAVRHWCAAGKDALAAARAEIDDLNVYPVPDGDTGTNLLMTMQAADDAVREAPADMAGTVAAMARGALLGARGNSGVILSQLLKGLAEVLGAAETGTAADLRRALSRAAELAYAAVANPVEGTVLTVARECAEAVAGLEEDLAAVVSAARQAAAGSLARTPELLPQLRAAGVVDAGGRGLCVLLEALERVVTGTTTPLVPSLVVPRERTAVAVAREEGSEEYAYEVQFLLRDADEAAVDALKASLSELGDSLVVVGGADVWNVHVHVNDVGAAVEAGVEAGRPFAHHRHPLRGPGRGAGRGAARAAGHERAARRPRGGRGRPGRGAGGAVPPGGRGGRARRAVAQPVHGRAARGGAPGRHGRGGAAAERRELHRRRRRRGGRRPRRGAVRGGRADPLVRAGARRARGRGRRAAVPRRRRRDGRGRRLDPLGRGHDRRARGGHHGRRLPPRRRARPARGRRRAHRRGRRGRSARSSCTGCSAVAASSSPS